MAENNVKALVQEGQSVWLDDISRQLLQSGEFARQIEEIGIRGDKSAGEIFEAVATDDIRNACELLRPLYDSTNGGDGFASIEVSPAFARDPESTLNDVRRLWKEIDRPNLMVKIPGTAEGVSAIKTALTEGI